MVIMRTTLWLSLSSATSPSACRCSDVHFTVISELNALEKISVGRRDSHNNSISIVASRLYPTNSGGLERRSAEGSMDRYLMELIGSLLKRQFNHFMDPRVVKKLFRSELIFHFILDIVFSSLCSVLMMSPVKGVAMSSQGSKVLYDNRNNCVIYYRMRPIPAKNEGAEKQQWIIHKTEL